MENNQIIAPLNICLVAQKFPLGGKTAENGFLWPIAQGLAAQGHQVSILTGRSFDRKKKVIQDQVHVYNLLENSSLSTSFPHMIRLQFEKLHKQKPFDIVHSIDSSSYYIAKNKKHYRIPIAFDVEATQMSQLFSIMGMAHENLGGMFRTAIAITYKFLITYFGRDRKLLKNADGVFVTSPQQRLILERHYLYPDVKIFTVPYGIELDISPKERSKEYLSAWGLPNNAKIAVTLSDMSELGELLNLLRAFQKAVVKKPSGRLIIIGNGPLWKTIEYEILNLALGSKVIMTGALTSDEVSDFLTLCDVFINISSRTSGFEPNILEAMAQKKIVIGSEVSPIANIIEDGKNGFLVRPADIQSISSLLLQVFSDSLSSVDIGEKARETVSNLFDTNKLIKQTLQAYYKIIQSVPLRKNKVHKINRANQANI